jgi:hypothetical protein
MNHSTNGRTKSECEAKRNRAGPHCRRNKSIAVISSLFISSQQVQTNFFRETGSADIPRKGSMGWVQYLNSRLGCAFSLAAAVSF